MSIAFSSFLSFIHFLPDNLDIFHYVVQFTLYTGRCEACSGDGIIKIEMHFLPDVYVPCEVCKGKRYNRETLEVKYKDKSIYDVLNMTVEEAMTFFENVPSIRRKIETLYDV